jgi:type IV pilus assembly protein PilB
MATHADIEWAIERHYGALSADAGIDSWGLEIEALEVEDNENDETSTAQAQRESQEKPIVRFVNGLLLDGVRARASDLHIRPGAKTVDILFRVDGELKTVRPLSRNLLAPVVSRIKIMGHMNIANRRRPQDGRIRMKLAGRVVDYRVSVMPTIHGESVVIRVQDKSAGLKDFASLGFAGRDAVELNDMLSRNAGIILVTGATGSGKSATLYAALQKLVERGLHVITVEDPVEAEVTGVEQIQVNNLADYTFASALRNILRHDPDAIMVGEIRDQETAQIALKSAMTGHLVLSTLHTNDAPSAIDRLIEMGNEPFVLGIALLGVLSQRLVRLNCPHCLRPEPVSKDVLARLGVDDTTVFYHGTGCKECDNSGCIGRTAVYELLRVTPAIRELINAKRPAADIRRVANQQGMVDLVKQALALAKAGKISLMQAYLVNQG